MATAGALTDPIPGNLGLELDDDTVVLLRFDEPAGVRASDAAGNLEDLTLVNVAGDMPTVTSAIAWASATTWYFGDDEQIGAVDRTGRDTLLTRDASVQVIWATVPNKYTAASLVRRGDSGTDRSLSIDVDTNTTPGTLLVRWSWEDSAGVEHADAWVSLPWTPLQLFLLTCTRRWVSSTEVVLRYYVGDTLVAESTSTEGDIAGSTVGRTSVGAADFEGYVDEVKIVGREISHEELRQTWARLTVHQPGGLTTFRGNAPPGAPWFRSPTSGPALLARVAGQAVGYAAAKAHELRETHLPDAAYREGIARWEALVGLQSRERLALQDRRAAVLARLQRENGYSPPAVRDVLAAPFDLAAVDVGLIEFSPTITDNFSALAPERWRADPVAAWTIVSGELDFAAGGAADLTVDPWRYRMAVDSDDGLIVQVKLADYLGGGYAIASTVIVGLYLLSSGGAFDELWFGVKNTAGTRQLGWVARSGGVLGAFTLLEASADVPYYLRITQLEQGGYQLWWSTVGFDDVGEIAVLSNQIEAVNNVGVGAKATTAASGATHVTFDDFLVRIPHGKRAFHWYAFRNLGFPGTPDIAAANALIPTLKPAHTHAAAITSLSLLCDNTGSGCDRGPLGGF